MTGTQNGPGGQGGPVLVLSYGYSGAGQVQDALAAGGGLACTSGTGIVPLCAAAGESWRRVEGRDGPAMSPLAAATVRGLVNAQVTAILAGAGKSRWCELATAPPDAAESFAQVFPQARFVCVHRSCLEVVRAAVRASPWGLQGQGLAPYLLAYPGNSVAVMASYWADAAEQLLAFEEASPGRACRVRHEDLIARPEETIGGLRAFLGLGQAEVQGSPQTPPQDGLVPADGPEQVPADVPTRMIPEPLRQRIGRLHARLGYPPP